MDSNSSPDGRIGDPTGPDLVSLARLLYGPAHALTGNRHEAEDLVHDTVAALIPRWAKLGRDRVSYARRALANRFIDGQRHRRVHLSYLRQLSPPRHVEPSSTNADIRMDLERALATLPKLTKDILILRYLIDLSAVDIASRLGMPAGSVRRLAHEGIQQMSALLVLADDEGADDAK